MYHLGEIAVQKRAGVQAEAERLAKVISSTIQPAAQDFLGKQRLAIASTVDASDRIWASLITGKPGFLQAVAAQTLRINSDVLGENLRCRDEIGLLAIDLATRRRLRLNGKAEVRSKREIYLHTQQVYFNCPKYIQVREIDADVVETSDRTVQILSALTQQQQFIHQADTFFIASYHPHSGADASHRGGYPGFVQVTQPNTLVFPDYSGNNMFNTLGNLQANPKAGLLFIDFERGNTLQLTGTATILWDAERSQFAGAERLVEFQVESAIATTNATPLRWRFGEYSPYLPD